jgi:YVTN family beta-propeller protein
VRMTTFQRRMARRDRSRPYGAMLCRSGDPLDGMVSQMRRMIAVPLIAAVGALAACGGTSGGHTAGPVRRPVDDLGPLSVGSVQRFTGVIPSDIAITPDGRHAYVPSLGSDDVSVIDTATDKVTTVRVGSDPEAVAISPDGRQVFVADGTAGKVAVIHVGAR